MALKHASRSLSFVQVFVLALIWILVLKFVGDWIWLGLTSLNPHHFSALISRTTQMRLAFLAAVFVPLLLAGILILFSGPHWDATTSYTRHLPFKTEQKLFNIRYSKDQVMDITKVILLIWGVLLLTQLGFSIIFQGYGPL